MGLIDAKNKVPQYQRLYQQAYKAHTRLWMIVCFSIDVSRLNRIVIFANYRQGSRSRWYMTPYLIVLWGGFGATMYAAGRKITGHNTWFGKD
ncbi:uncharacterized protein MAM_01695 [Metarhizium album ARSEF 1941]|uniref:Uncharacterized protein n=1 Tax=Metarhizium album (strain ARSEF 1941) TaxID=1081103 RepID=A0A0B2WXC9_METAS|nr:uncharacterized protein MAM_01695 [Metarhizium album ARSEF 1941]KHO00917.1 hypothetical protein MAM_01695 [Metarhizium album ARSEF 1941]